VGRFLVRLVLCLIGGFAGSAAGFALFQLRSAQSEIDSRAADITVAAPPITAAIAAAIGLISGRRGPLLSFFAGTALSAALGTALDERVTGIAAAQARRASSTSSSHSSG
jgi:hypothetical protein